MVSVKWNEIFNMKTPDWDGYFLPILTYNVVLDDIVGKCKQEINIRPKQILLVLKQRFNLTLARGK